MKENLIQWFNEGNITFPSALLTFYKQMGINEEELVLLLHVFSFQEKGNEFPTPSEISSRMTISLTQCSDMLRRLVQKGLIEIQDGHSYDGIRFEKYSLQPLWEKLIEQFLMNTKNKYIEKQQQEETDLYTCFEQEFGRPLSPFECESLAMWMDDDRHDPIIIKSALREAVISGKLNFRYIDRILFEWKRNGIKTIEQAKNHGRKIRQHQPQQREKKEEVPQTKNVPFYNWLEQ
ncbi:DnaD domain-containing protein [Bacillus sp. 31A1R]|uniref:DnaD domain-containing protein n=1 Tax=Robertmurraya mangrovi TaxID=3098077 RepID=A0ABU5J1D5_9BACI|nr:DnaD domain-containing protein [Bacillus sp. 31A1R]MDZ5473224.1 DnaD domain-containing protein [Bacillus sp. 31A1R]